MQLQNGAVRLQAASEALARLRQMHALLVRLERERARRCRAQRPFLLSVQSRSSGLEYSQREAANAGACASCARMFCD